jgi:acetyl-CoA carboxylase carboxyl transferase subunit alpha
MLEYSIYSVIAPESCSAILWRDQEHSAEAAEALKLTPEDLRKHHLIDEIVREPEGGAHNDAPAMAKCLASVLKRQLDELRNEKPENLISCRYKKFRAMGAFGE